MSLTKLFSECVVLQSEKMYLVTTGLIFFLNVSSTTAFKRKKSSDNSLEAARIRSRPLPLPLSLTA